MVKVTKIQGYLPAVPLAQRLIAPPYDVLDTDEARVMAEGNPHSFLHVNKPEIDLPPETDPYADIVYETGRVNLQAFIDKGWLVHDDLPRIYIYAVTMKGRTQYGVVAGASVDDYASNRIKKHELTRKKKEEDRTKLTNVQSANVGPVFLTYRARDSIDGIVAAVVARTPHIDVVTDDDVRHVVSRMQLWLCAPEESDSLIQLFSEVPEVYIADGHHRAASAFNVGIMRKQQFAETGKVITGDEDFTSFLAIFYPDNQLKIFDYNRVLKTLCGHSPDEVMAALNTNFELVEITDPHPPEKGTFSIFISGKWTGLKLRPGVVTATDPVSNLDSEILTDLVLKPIFGIEDLRTDERIDFVGGIRGLEELERRCHSDCICAFALHPVKVTEVMTIADASMLMPPKSTWFEPKPRSGMIVRLFQN